MLELKFNYTYKNFNWTVFITLITQDKNMVR